MKYLPTFQQCVSLCTNQNNSLKFLSFPICRIYQYPCNFFRFVVIEIIHPNLFHFQYFTFIIVTRFPLNSADHDNSTKLISFSIICIYEYRLGRRSYRIWVLYRIPEGVVRSQKVNGGYGGQKRLSARRWPRVNAFNRRTPIPHLINARSANNYGRSRGLLITSRRYCGK